jgi:hypothetical protein
MKIKGYGRTELIYVGHVLHSLTLILIQTHLSTHKRDEVSVLYSHCILMNLLPGVRFQVLTAASMKFRFVFWDVLQCKIIVDQRFRGTCCVHHQGDRA